MKNISLALSALSLVGVIVLFVMNSQNSEINIEKEITLNDSTITEAKVPTGVFASIDVQRITLEYAYYQEIVIDLEAKQKRAESQLRNKAQSFQSEYEAYMKKAQMGAFLSQQSQQDQEQDLMQKQENLKALEQDLSIKLQTEMQQLDAQANDTVMKYLKEYNREAKYDLILNSATILDPGVTVDVTDTIISLLNHQYNLQKSIVE